MFKNNVRFAPPFTELSIAFGGLYARKCTSFSWHFLCRLYYTPRGPKASLYVSSVHIYNTWRNRNCCNMLCVSRINCICVFFLSKLAGQPAGKMKSVSNKINMRMRWRWRWSSVIFCDNEYGYLMVLGIYF